MKAELIKAWIFSSEGPSIKALKAKRLAFLCVKFSEAIKSV